MSTCRAVLLGPCLVNVCAGRFGYESGPVCSYRGYPLRVEYRCNHRFDESSALFAAPCKGWSWGGPAWCAS